MKTYAFESLDTWKKAKDLSLLTYRITSTFPRTETFGITSQMRRASISVCSNLVEGNSRFSAKEKARYTEMSYGSLMELLSQAMIGVELNYIKTEDMYQFRLIVDEVSTLLRSLRKAQLSQLP